MSALCPSLGGIISSNTCRCACVLVERHIRLSCRSSSFSGSAPSVTPPPDATSALVPLSHILLASDQFLLRPLSRDSSRLLLLHAPGYPPVVVLRHFLHSLHQSCAKTVIVSPRLFPSKLRIVLVLSSVSLVLFPVVFPGSFLSHDFL